MPLSISKISLLVSYLIIILGLCYKPKWKMEHTHATISYDVSGYYIYLPAIFIYGDLQKVGFKENIHQKYRNSSHTYQTFTHSSGNEIAQYSCGLALQYLPFFLIADFLASPLGYERDGYSLPYQTAIHWGSALIAFLGLFYLRKNLLAFFSEKATSITLLLLIVGTNYLNYVTMDVAMTHNYLFTLYSLLIWNTIQFYEKPNLKRATFIGLIVGLAALTRPSEIMIALIPLFWSVSVFRKNENSILLSQRFKFITDKIHLYSIAVVVCVGLGSLQLIYWKIIGGEWIINSYQDNFQFDWFHPHYKNGLFSFRKGWLIYTPMMIFPILGLCMMLWKKHPLAEVISLYLVLFSYLTFAWSIWWYGGSLGQRALVQSYALLAFPFCYFIEYILKNKKRLIPFVIIAMLFSYYNIWLHHQAHYGGMLDPENMTQKYYWKILGKWKKNRDDQIYLDTDEEFKGIRKNIKEIYYNDFEKDSTIQQCEVVPIEGGFSYCISNQTELNGFYSTPISSSKNKWVRISGTFRQKGKEWTVWKMPQLILRFKKGNEVVKFKLFRPTRMMNDNETRELFIDSKIPEKELTEIEVVFWSGETPHPVILDNLKIETFE